MTPMEALLKLAHDDAVNLRSRGWSQFDAECSILTAFAGYSANNDAKTIEFFEVIRKVYANTPPRPDLPSLKDPIVRSN